MGRGDYPKTFLLKALFCQSTPSWLKVVGGGGGGPGHFTVISWYWAYFLFFIPRSHFPFCRSQVPIPRSQVLPKFQVPSPSCLTIQGWLWDERPSKNYPQRLTTQRQKSFESHLSSTIMRVKLVCVYFNPVWCHVLGFDDVSPKLESVI